MRVVVASDANGVDLRLAIARHLQSSDPGISCEDLTPTDVSAIDGPEIADQVARAVLDGRAERGILVCGSGVGLAIAVNKVPGIRGVLCRDTATAAHARRSSDTQVLVLGSSTVDPALAVAIVDVWLAEPYEDNPRRRRRLHGLVELESKYTQRGMTPPHGPYRADHG